MLSSGLEGGVAKSRSLRTPGFLGDRAREKGSTTWGREAMRENRAGGGDIMMERGHI